MTEAPERIFLLPKDAALFGQKYGHPDVQQAHVGDDSVQYVRADLARPVTVAEAAKVLLDCDDTVVRLAKGLAAKAYQRGLSVDPNFIMLRHPTEADYVTDKWDAYVGDAESNIEILRDLSHEGGE